MQKQAIIDSFNPAKFLGTAAPGRIAETHKEKAVLFAQGDPADAVFYVTAGDIKVTVTSAQGRKAVVAIVGPNEFLGEGCLIGQPKRLSTASAMAACATMRIEKASILRVLNDEPKFSTMFMKHILSHSARVEADFVDQLFNNTEKRLARLLLQMADFGKEGHPEPFIGAISQEMLAGMVGTTRSHVSHFMNKFRRLGYINYGRGGVTVNSSLLGMTLKDTPHTVKVHEKDTTAIDGTPLDGKPK